MDQRSRREVKYSDERGNTWSEQQVTLCRVCATREQEEAAAAAAEIARWNEAVDRDVESLIKAVLARNPRPSMTLSHTSRVKVKPARGARCALHGPTCKVTRVTKFGRGIWDATYEQPAWEVVRLPGADRRRRYDDYEPCDRVWALSSAGVLHATVGGSFEVRSGAEAIGQEMGLIAPGLRRLAGP